MKVLLIHRYFWPDTPPYAVMLRDMAATLAENGHDVTVLSTQPSYKKEFRPGLQPSEEQVAGFRIIRRAINLECRRGMFSRLIDAFRFCLAIVREVVSGRYDVAMIATTPPVLGGLALMLASKICRKRYFYHCQDIYPEVAYCSGMLKKGIFYRMIQWLDQQVCRHAAVTIVLSDDMKGTLLARPGKVRPENIHIINNFELRENTQAIAGERQPLPSLPAGFKVIFAGNIGRFQQLDTVLDAARCLREQKEIQFVFVGEGAYLQELKRKAGEMIGNTVHFIGHQPVESARRLIGEADIGLVTIQKGLIECAFPSKTMTYWSEGLPIIAMVEKESELAQMILSNEFGYVVQPGDAGEMTRVIERAFEHRTKLVQSRKIIRETAEQYFSANHVLKKWSALFRDEAQRIETQ